MKELRLAKRNHSPARATRKPAAATVADAPAPSDLMVAIREAKRAATQIAMREGQADDLQRKHAESAAFVLETSAGGHSHARSERWSAARRRLTSTSSWSAYLADLRDAATVLASLKTWFDDYNEHHPHRGLGMRSPREYRERVQALLSTAA